MPIDVEQLDRLTSKMLHEENALRALERLLGVRAALDVSIRGQVARALEQGYSFADVAELLGISRQAAHRRFRDLRPALPPGGEKRRLSTTGEAERVLRATSEEAHGAGAAIVGAEHVPVAILRCGGRTAELLQDSGMTLALARAYVRSVALTPRPGTRSADPHVGVRRILAEAMRIAAARGQDRVDSDVLLLAALDGPESGARTLLTALGVRLPALRRRLATEQM